MKIREIIITIRTRKKQLITFGIKLERSHSTISPAKPEENNRSLIMRSDDCDSCGASSDDGTHNKDRAANSGPSPGMIYDTIS